MIVNGVEYLTKEEAAQCCREFAFNNPGTKFHNYAHSKCVRRKTTAIEQQADFTSGRAVRLSVTLYEWSKVYVADPILKTNPELAGMWRQVKL